VTITRADLEAKAREITTVVNDTKETAQNTAILAGVAVLVAVGISYLMGRRKARSGRAVVEVYRI
jgi:ABC-type dipeptide/oligopeptide/nickel transport system permease component